MVVPSGPDGEAMTVAAKDYQGVMGKTIYVVTAPYADLLQKEMSAGSAQEGAYDLPQVHDPWFQLLANHKWVTAVSPGASPLLFAICPILEAPPQPDVLADHQPTESWRRESPCRLNRSGENRACQIFLKYRCDMSSPRTDNLS
jgi:hypothetical protein